MRDLPGGQWDGNFWSWIDDHASTESVAAGCPRTIRPSSRRCPTRAGGLTRACPDAPRAASSDDAVLVLVLVLAISISIRIPIFIPRRQTPSSLAALARASRSSIARRVKPRRGQSCHVACAALVGSRAHARTIVRPVRIDARRESSCRETTSTLALALPPRVHTLSIWPTRESFTRGLARHRSSTTMVRPWRVMFLRRERPRVHGRSRKLSSSFVRAAAFDSLRSLPSKHEPAVPQRRRSS